MTARYYINFKRIGEPLMLDILQIIRRNVNILIRLLPVFSFIPALAILYSLHAWSFEQTLHGRTFLIFFLWLVSLEIILSWEKLQKNNVSKLRSIRTVLFVIAILLPTIYVIAANHCGLNAMIDDLATQLKVEKTAWPTVSAEYMVFAVFFGLIILLAYGISGLTDFSISTFFLGIIGILFTVDNLYPWGRFRPLQIFVPATATLAANVLNLMGYRTTITYVVNHPIYGSYPSLTVVNFPWASFGIAWPCSGVESFLIYTVTILLFLKKTDISWKHKIIYFAIGAVVTYFINVLRVVTLFLIAIGKGATFNTNDYDWQRFHNYYGMLYSMTWIMLYPLIIMGSQTLWRKIRNSRTVSKGEIESLKVTQK
jgi:thaumarchaeosortase